MLFNNLDPEVAEHPEDLVVYGGSGGPRGRTRPSGNRRDTPAAPRQRDAARSVRQAGRRVPHARRGAAGADRELAARTEVGDVGRVPPARGRGADDVRADDGWLVDLHRDAGDSAGDVSDVLRGRRGAFRLGRPDRAHGSDGGPRGHGGRPAACGNDGGGRDPLRGGRPAVDRSPPRDAIWWTSRTTSLDDAVARVRAAAAAGTPLSVALRGNAEDVFPELVARGEHFDLVTDQTAAHVGGGGARRGAVRGGGGAPRAGSKALSEACLPVDRGVCPRQCDFVRMGCMFRIMARIYEGRCMREV